MKTQNWNVILDPEISRPARLLWAVLRYCEQEGEQLKVDELSTILGVNEKTVMKYLYELRDNGCLTMARVTSVQYTPIVPQSPTAESAICPSGPSKPHLN